MACRSTRTRYALRGNPRPSKRYGDAVPASSKVTKERKKKTTQAKVTKAPSPALPSPKAPAQARQLSVTAADKQRFRRGTLMELTKNSEIVARGYENYLEWLVRLERKGLPEVKKQQEIQEYEERWLKEAEEDMREETANWERKFLAERAAEGWQMVEGRWVKSG